MIESCRLKTIGITGGIGSGKSYVSDILRKEFGIPVYDCDKEAKRLTATDPDIRRRLIQLVGPEVFNGQELNKKLLADYLFANPENARKVNAIIHPAVQEDFKLWAGRQQKPITALESAILFESGFNGLVDKVILVDAPEDVRLKRAMLRDTATEAQIRTRMKMQSAEANKDKADFIIDNNTADDTRLLEQLTKLVQNLVNS